MRERRPYRPLMIRVQAGGSGLTLLTSLHTIEYLAIHDAKATWLSQKQGELLMPRLHVNDIPLLIEALADYHQRFLAWEENNKEDNTPDD